MNRLNFTFNNKTVGFINPISVLPKEEASPLKYTPFKEQHKPIDNMIELIGSYLLITYSRGIHYCFSCHTENTPIWRPHEICVNYVTYQIYLCNKCGLRIKRTNPCINCGYVKKISEIHDCI